MQKIIITNSALVNKIALVDFRFNIIQFWLQGEKKNQQNNGGLKIHKLFFMAYWWTLQFIHLYAMNGLEHRAYSIEPKNINERNKNEQTTEQKKNVDRNNIGIRKVLWSER